tara:strand:+ start:6176 stop:6931 length:756 start_codon:yes stop_codon:yes gene_type:complete
MIIYSKDELKIIYDDVDFIESYKLYNDKYNLNEFLDSIDTNKDYYKLKISSKYDQSENNKIMQTILEYLNKVTCNNYIDIKNNIIKLLVVDIVDEYIKHILEKIIQHEFYSKEYKFILNEVNKIYDKKCIINMHINSIYDSINKNKNKNNSDYDKLCNHNRLVDNLIGYYRMIIQVNSLNLFEGSIDNIISDIIINIKDSDEDNQYKYLQCLLSIIKNDKEKHNLIDKDLSNHLKSKKNKFLLMDINDLLN